MAAAGTGNTAKLMANELSLGDTGAKVIYNHTIGLYL